jgi:inosine-uridine nucleoside N-ribohydrolase
VDCVNERPGEVTILALASLTNVALALHLDPGLGAKVKSLVYLGGAFFVMGNVNPACEANVWHDPEAADWVLGAFPDGVTRIVGLDVTTRSIMTAADLDTLRDSGGASRPPSDMSALFSPIYYLPPACRALRQLRVEHLPVLQVVPHARHGRGRHLPA